MPTYRINFEQIRQQPALAHLLDALEKAFAHFGIDFYLVGAVSRDVWMSGIHNLAPKRTTGDIDFAVLINAEGLYEQLRGYLVDTGDFTPSRENAFVFIYKDGTPVDLLPFGAIEDDDRRVTVDGTGFTSVHVGGFKEVYEKILPQVALGAHRFKFCSLPGIVLLKLIAWDDRPEARRDDVLDISNILHHYFDMNSEEIWEEHHDLFAREDAELIEIAAIVLGRQISAIVATAPALQTRIKGILIANTQDPAKSKMALIMVDYFSNTIADNVKLLSLVLSGLGDAKV